jgi:P4 family phage/plasmid primase-like protien
MPTSKESRRRADGEANLAAAHDYLAMGWPVLAECPPDHAGMSERHLASCKSNGKRPWHCWAPFQPDANGRLPTPVEVDEWWRAHPTSNVGLALGAHVRIDIEGPQARARLGELSGGDLPDTLEFTSGRGDGTGEGWLYVLPADIRLRTAKNGMPLGGELRLQALGAQTVLPPSRHASGRAYAWKPGRGPKDTGLAPAPAWLLAALRDAKLRTKPDRPKRIGGNTRAIAIALAALEGLNPSRADDYGGWLKVGMILHSVDEGEEMLAAWDAWSKRSAKYEDGICECKWASFSADGGLTLGSLIYWAKEDAQRNGHVETAPPSPPSQPTPGVYEAADDPHRLARLYIAERCEHRDGLTLRSRREQWHRWDGSAYREFPDAELQGELTASAKHEMDRLNLVAQESAEAGKPPPTVRKITRGMIGNVEMALASMTVLPSTVEPPLWRDGWEWKHRNLIALSNGLLDLDALFAGEAGFLLRHTPRWFSPTCLPYPYDPDADCPHWRAFLERNLEGEAERIALLQEWFGYCATADTSRQKFLLLEGEGANGKSVVCAALEAMLGSENCSHVPLEVFGARFQLEATLGKLANIASEVGELDRAAEGFLKSFTSGDVMQFELKHKPTFSATPTARLVLATNNRPRFSDRSAGIWRRMILMPFRVTIADDDSKRVLGMDKPAWWDASGELPGIFNWALAGLERLRRQNRFTTSKVCDEALAEYRTENNPTRLYLTETCQEAPDGQTPCEELYADYRRWCEVNGYSPLAARAFGKEVKRVFPKTERRRGGREKSAIGATAASTTPR